MTETDLDILYQERAAIMEFDGGLSRAEAERLAWHAVYVRREVKRTAGGGVATKYTMVAPKPEPPPKPALAEPQQQSLFGQDDFRAIMKQIWNDY